MNVSEMLSMFASGGLDKETLDTSMALKQLFAVMNYLSLAHVDIKKQDDGAQTTNAEAVVLAFHHLLTTLLDRNDPIYKSVGVMEREISVMTIKKFKTELFGAN